MQLKVWIVSKTFYDAAFVCSCNFENITLLIINQLVEVLLLRI